MGDAPSPTPTREEVTHELVESLRVLATEVNNLKSPTIFKRTRRNILRIGLGFLIGAGTVLLWPAGQPERFPRADQGNKVSEKPDEEPFYTATLRRQLDACARRWGNIFSIEHIASDGTVTVSLPQGIYASGNYVGSLTLQCDENRHLKYLRENQHSSTLEIWPDHHDIRQEIVGADGAGGLVTQTTCITQEDTLEGIRTSDGRQQELKINGERVNPAADPEELARLLSTPHRVALFQQVFCEYEGPEKLFEFLLSSEFTSDYRVPFAEFQRRGLRGNCNDFTEMACEILDRHGFATHVLSVWPKETHDRLTEPWHQVAAIPQPDGSLLIIDNGHLIYRDSKEAYAQQYSSSDNTVVIPGDAGYFRWERADNAFARWLQHLGVRYRNTK